MSPDKKEKLAKARNHYRKVWAARKEMVMDLVLNMADGMEKKPKVVIVRG